MEKTKNISRNEDHDFDEVMNFIFGDKKLPVHELRFSDGTTGFLEPIGGFDPEKHVYVRLGEERETLPEVKKLIEALKNEC